ncbi:MAG: hypothetical protein RLN76_06635 [Phycisphaeraceae bacterium]
MGGRGRAQPAPGTSNPARVPRVMPEGVTRGTALHNTPDDRSATLGATL